MVLLSIGRLKLSNILRKTREIKLEKRQFEEKIERVRVIRTCFNDKFLKI